MKNSLDRGSVSLRTSLNVFAGIALMGALSVGAISFWGSHKSSTATEQTNTAKDLMADILPPPLYLIEMRLMLSQFSEGYLASSEAREKFERIKKDFNDRNEYWRASAPGELKGGLLGRQMEHGTKFMDATEKVLKMQADGASADEMRVAIQEAHKFYVEHREGVLTTVKDVTAFTDASLDNYRRSMALSRQLQIGGLALVGTLIVVMAYRIRRSIWSAVGGEPVHAAKVASAVAQGDLTTPIQLDAGDRNSIMSNLKTMQTQLMQTVRNVRDNAERVSIASAEIAAANMDLSNRTETQAASLEQTVTSIQHLGDAARQSAASARDASAKAHNASTVAVQGGEVVSEVVHTMRGINEASRKISEIISVIDGIAFQTNILALNAAVEAARAGEQGRGFAVVASEVRSLAGRSAEAAKEISHLINASVEKVEQGTVLVDRAGVTMGEVVESIRSVTDIIGSISVASDRQAQGVTQVGQAISLMDQGTQQNAAQVEQMAAATQSLKSQSQDLVRTVSLFTLDGNSTPRITG